MGTQNSRFSERKLNDKGQSRSDLDNQGCDSQRTLDKSEGQLLEDVKVDGPVLSPTRRS
jgi:hypothetical protein